MTESPSQESIRVVAFTTFPQVALGFDQLLTALGHRLVGIVTTPGPALRRSSGYIEVVRSARPNLDIIVSSHPARLAAMVAPLRPALILCGSFPWRIPAEVIALPRFGAINGHPAALPKYRGPNSVGWALRNGDSEIGFTVHRMDGDFDTGPILAQGAVQIGDDDTAETAFSQLGPLVFSLYPQAIRRVLQGDSGEPQDEARASNAPLFDPEDRYIDWTRPAREIHNFVRSWHGMGDVARGAFAHIDGEQMLVTRTRLLDEERASDASAGTVLRRENGALVVQCGDGPLHILNHEPVAAIG